MLQYFVLCSCIINRYYLDKILYSLNSLKVTRAFGLKIEKTLYLSVYCTIHMWVILFVLDGCETSL